MTQTGDTGGVPTPGPCAVWCASSDVEARLTEPQKALLNATQITTACDSASSILYALSGRQFAGQCEGYVRPSAKPWDWQHEAFVTNYGFGWNSSWGMTMWDQRDGWVYRQGVEPPRIELGAYPLTSILEVLIDGVTIPSDEYRIDDYKWLVRVRPTATAAPTDRWGWPTIQMWDMPDTQPGTFSVSFMYGVPPPPEGVQAAAALAKELALDAVGQANALPKRLQSVSRAGVSARALDPMQLYKMGFTGIPTVDLFITTYNPNGMRRRAGFWTPDTGRNSRPTG